MPEANNTPTEKYCTKCKKWNPLSSYSEDKRRKDGLQKWCKRCVHEHKLLVAERRAANSPAMAKRAQKLKDVLAKTAENGGDMLQAYADIAGRPEQSPEAVRKSLYRFMDIVAKNDCLSDCAKKVSKNPALHQLFDDYLQAVQASKNPAYMKDALLLVAKLAGELVERHDIRQPSQEESDKAFDERMAKIHSRMNQSEDPQ